MVQEEAKLVPVPVNIPVFGNQQKEEKVTHACKLDLALYNMYTSYSIKGSMHTNAVAFTCRL